jgi:tetratricopeptide (TPR) repeat protein
MSAKVKMFVWGAVFCALIVAGCRSNGSATVAHNSRTASDIRMAQLQQELDKKWENPTAQYEMGQLYHAAGDWSKAEYRYNIALGFDPAYRDVQAAIVKLQFDRGDKAKGEWAANSFMTQVASSPEQLLALGMAFEKQGLNDYALKCYTNALQVAPDSAVVNSRLAYYYQSKGKSDLAKEYFIRSFQLNPNQPDIANELGKLGVEVKIPAAAAPASENLSKPVKPANSPK